MIKRFLSKYSSMILFLIIIAVGGYIWFQDSKISKLESDISTLKDNNSKLLSGIETQREAIKYIEGRYREISSRYSDLNKSMSKLQQEQSDIKAKYNEYRNRLKKLSKKNPEAIERITNSGIDDIMLKFSRDNRYQPEADK